MNQITTFSEVKAELKNYWNDPIRIEQVMIEAHTCPKCDKSLEFKGFGSISEHRAYGICEKCDYAELFWIERIEMSNFKKKVCEAVKEAA